jgi:dTDP-4-amino-4,6-dideoxygalactose transaminase
MIPVTKTYLPPLEEYTAYLEKIWKSGWITNNGPLVIELEEKLKEYFEVKHLFLTSNGTIAIQIAIKSLGITKEIITTPFSYVATTTSVLWENCKPVFVDIDKKTFCIDPSKIEEKITGSTEAILATHVYGIPCNVEKIEKIARKHNLKIIYDAAHSFGTIYRNKQLAHYGDVSTLSFHATKLFHTIEGGAIIVHDDVLAETIKLYRSFGHIGNNYYTMGINGKNSEVHAAMGLCMLSRVPELIEKRKELYEVYTSLLNPQKISIPSVPEGTLYNYSYYPVLLENEEKLNYVTNALKNNNIIPRRYFYPSLNQLPYLNKVDSCAVSEDYSSRVLCLPLYNDLAINDVKRIIGIINKIL